VTKPTDLIGLSNAVLSLYELWRNGDDGLQVGPEACEYERSHLTNQLASILDSLSSQASSKA
jgi:hypothetical protein